MKLLSPLNRNAVVALILLTVGCFSVLAPSASFAASPTLWPGAAQANSAKTFTVTINQSCNGGRKVTDGFRWEDGREIFTSVALVSVQVGGRAIDGWIYADEHVNSTFYNPGTKTTLIRSQYFDSFKGPGVENISRSNPLRITFTANVSSKSGKTWRLSTFQHCSGNVTDMEYKPGITLRVTK